MRSDKETSQNSIFFHDKRGCWWWRAKIPPFHLINITFPLEGPASSSSLKKECLLNATHFNSISWRTWPGERVNKFNYFIIYFSLRTSIFPRRVCFSMGSCFPLRNETLSFRVATWAYTFKLNIYPDIQFEKFDKNQDAFKLDYSL